MVLPGLEMEAQEGSSAENQKGVVFSVDLHSRIRVSPWII